MFGMGRLLSLWLFLWASKRFGPMSIMRQWALTKGQSWDFLIYQKRKDACGRDLYHLMWDQYSADTTPEDPMTVFCAVCTEDDEAPLQECYILTPYGMFPWDSIRSVYTDPNLMRWS